MGDLTTFETIIIAIVEGLTEFLPVSSTGHMIITVLIGGRLAYIQLVDSRYNELAKANVLRHVVQYPPRGIRTNSHTRPAKSSLSQRRPCRDR